MKKLWIILTVLFLSVSLSGCMINEPINEDNNNNQAQEETNKEENNNEEKEDTITTKTCTITNAAGLKQTFAYTATNDEITKVTLTKIFSNDALGVNDFSSMTEDQKEDYKNNMLNSIELDSTTYEGLSITFKFEKQLSMVIEADLTKADLELLQKVGLDFSNNKNIDTQINNMTQNGATCK